MKLNVINKLIMVFLLSLFFSINIINTVEAKTELQIGEYDSIYSYVNGLDIWYPEAKITKDNRGYYFTYKNNGYFEVYLGNDSFMSFSDFASKLGGGCNTITVKKTVTETEYELEKLSIGALTAFLTKDLTNWKAAYIIGAISDSYAGRYLRKPGTYQFSNNVYTVKKRNGAVEGNPYDETHYIYADFRIYKEQSGKWYLIYQKDKNKLQFMI